MKIHLSRSEAHGAGYHPAPFSPYLVPFGYVQGEAFRHEEGIRHLEQELQLAKDRYGRIVNVVGEFHDLMHMIEKK